MTAPARHLHLVDGTTGEATEVCWACVGKDKTIASQARKITRLENEAETKVEKRPVLHPQIMEVCLFHKRLLTPRWKIVQNKGAYRQVGARLRQTDAETGGPAYTVDALRAASVGLSVCEWAREKGIRSAGWLFGPSPADKRDHVEWMLEEFEQLNVRLHGSSAAGRAPDDPLGIIDRLGAGGYERLAALCSHCGRTRLEHEREPDGQGLFDPLCPGFDSFDWEIDVWRRTRDRLAMERAALGDEVA